MAVLEIIKAPDDRLKQKAEPVDKVDDDLRAFIDDMFDTMYDNQGIGLAATQVGDLRRVLVLDVDQQEGDKNPMVFVNPEIIAESEEQNTYLEGCLSFPGQYAEVKRPKFVTIKYLDYDGNEQSVEADELLATCIQHEIDHLNGVVFVDHLSRLKRDMIIKKLIKEKKLAAS